jgi:hypothetical protein
MTSLCLYLLKNCVPSSRWHRRLNLNIPFPFHSLERCSIMMVQHLISLSCLVTTVLDQSTRRISISLRFTCNSASLLLCLNPRLFQILWNGIEIIVKRTRHLFFLFLLNNLLYLRLAQLLPLRRVLLLLHYDNWIIEFKEIILMILMLIIRHHHLRLFDIFLNSRSLIPTTTNTWYYSGSSRWLLYRSFMTFIPILLLLSSSRYLLLLNFDF